LATRATTPATTAARADRAAASAEAAHRSALELTLAPVTADQFLADFWEREPLVVPRAEPDRFSRVLSLADAERLVCQTGIRVPGIRLVKEGAQLPLAGYTEDIPWRPGAFSGSAVVERVAAEFAAGATIVLQALHLNWPAAALYCRGLEAALGCPVQANAYLTPATSQGFAVHHDTHDVFVLQVAGQKRWRIYAPVLELPLKEQRWSPELGDPGPPTHELTLDAGDTLYLPRGWPHEAVTADAESLHLTIGLHPTTRMDAMRMALDSCADDLEFRRSLPADGSLLADLLDRLAARLDPAQVARRARRRFVESRRPISHDQLDQLRRLDELDAATPVERRPTVLALLEDADGGKALIFERKELRFPAKAATAVEALTRLTGPFTAADLPGPLDTEGRLVLVRRLVGEGVLRIA
jgi:bifunctional lysine-specific demethylase and histidyl-hydroxylase NO66